MERRKKYGKGDRVPIRATVPRAMMVWLQEAARAQGISLSVALEEKLGRKFRRETSP